MGSLLNLDSQNRLRMLQTLLRLKGKNFYRGLYFQALSVEIRSEAGIIKELMN